MPRREASTTILVSPETREKLKRLKEEMGAGSIDEVIEALIEFYRSRPPPAPASDGALRGEILEMVAQLKSEARRDPSAVIVFIERKLAPKITEVYEYARARAEKLVVEEE